MRLTHKVVTVISIARSNAPEPTMRSLRSLDPNVGRRGGNVIGTDGTYAGVSAATASFIRTARCCQ